MKTWKRRLWCRRRHAWVRTWHPHTNDSWTRRPCHACRDHDDEVGRKVNSRVRVPFWPR